MEPAISTQKPASEPVSEWDFDRQTISVYDEPKEKESNVLNRFGEPFLIIHKQRIGFDLTPKKDYNARKTSW